jgi:predicted nuclease of restriction endonuclease-like (RecB) superfamily
MNNDGQDYVIAPNARVNLSQASRTEIPDGYSSFFQEVKEKVQQTRLRSVLAANTAMVRLYWEIGKSILQRQQLQGWGSRVVDRLARDLSDAFPEIKGLSATNLKYMRRFAELCPERAIGQQPADQWPWFHIVTLITRVSSEPEREWYAGQAIEAGYQQSLSRGCSVVSDRVNQRTSCVHRCVVIRRGPVRKVRMEVTRNCGVSTTASKVHS